MLLLTVLAAALTLGAVTLLGGDDETKQAAAPAPRAPAEAPTPAQPSGGGPAEPAPKSKPAPPQKPALAGAVRLRTANFAVSVPEGWTNTATADLGQVLSPVGADQTQVQIFVKIDPALGSAEMIDSTQALLKQRHPGAEISQVRNLSLSGVPAYSLEVRTPKGAEMALGALSGDNRYLVLTTIAPDAPPEIRREAVAVERSFQPS